MLFFALTNRYTFWHLTVHSQRMRRYQSQSYTINIHTWAFRYKLSDGKQLLFRGKCNVSVQTSVVQLVKQQIHNKSNEWSLSLSRHRFRTFVITTLTISLILRVTNALIRPTECTNLQKNLACEWDELCVDSLAKLRGISPIICTISLCWRIIA